MIEYICPHCGNKLQIPDKFAGQKGTCRTCGGEIIAARSSGSSEPSITSPVGIEGINIDVDAKPPPPIIVRDRTRSRGGGGGGGFFESLASFVTAFAKPAGGLLTVLCVGAVALSFGYSCPLEISFALPLNFFLAYIGMGLVAFGCLGFTSERDTSLSNLACLRHSWGNNRPHPCIAWPRLGVSRRVTSPCPRTCPATGARIASAARVRMLARAHRMNGERRGGVSECPFFWA